MSTANPFTHGNTLGQPGALYTGSPFGNVSPLVGANLPAQARPGMTIGGPAKRRTGLIPMAPGSRHTVVLKTPDGEERVGKERLIALKMALRKADREEKEAMNAWIDDQSDKRAKEYVVTQSRAAAALSVWTMANARGNKPTQIHLLTAQDPSAVPEAFGDEEHLPQWVCTHEACQGHRWDQERDLRTAHPSTSQMQGTGAVHVFGLYCEAPMDPSDPEGGQVGLIAPVGADGLTAAAVARAYLTGLEIPGVEGAPPQEIRRPGQKEED